MADLIDLSVVMVFTFQVFISTAERLFIAASCARNMQSRAKHRLAVQIWGMFLRQRYEAVMRFAYRANLAIIMDATYTPKAAPRLLASPSIKEAVRPIPMDPCASSMTPPKAAHPQKTFIFESLGHANAMPHARSA